MGKMIQIANGYYELDGTLPFLEAFAVRDGEADGRLRICRGVGAPLEKILFTYKHEELLVHQLEKEAWIYASPEDRAPAQLLADAEHKNLILFLPDWEDMEAQNIKAMHLIRTAMESRFCRSGVLSLHAAAVSWKGTSVAFTGHSGVGKSTRAAMWIEALGAKLISGDRPALVTGDSPWISGVPWDGKEQTFRNVSFPLAAILDVRRSEKTRIRRLSPAQIQRLLTQQCSIPMWNTAVAAEIITTIHRAAEQLPVYRLFCGPDPASAQAACKILFAHPEQILEVEKDMKVRKGFTLKKVVKEYIVMPTGDNVAKFDGAVILNEVSAFIYQMLRDPMSREDLLQKILEEFDVDEQTACRDLDEALAQFQELGIVEKEA